MCLDKVWEEWGAAWMSKKPFKALLRHADSCAMAGLPFRCLCVGIGKDDPRFSSNVLRL
jgi:hypothetical protein